MFLYVLGVLAAFNGLIVDFWWLLFYGISYCFRLNHLLFLLFPGVFYCFSLFFAVSCCFLLFLKVFCCILLFLAWVKWLSSYCSFQATAGLCRASAYCTSVRDCSTAWCRPISASRSHTVACSASAYGGAASGSKCWWTTAFPLSTGSWPSFTAPTRTSSGRVCWRRPTPSKGFCYLLLLIDFSYSTFVIT